MDSFPPAAADRLQDPIQRQASLQDLLNKQTQGQLAQTQNAIGQQQLSAAKLQEEDSKAMTRAMRDWDGKDYTQLPSLILKNGGSANAVFAATQHLQDMRAKAATIAKDDAATGASNQETQIKQNDQYRGRLQSIISAPADQKQALWDNEITAEEQAGKIKPGSISHTYPGDDQATVWANHFALGSVLAKEATEATQANARKTTADTAATQLQDKLDPNSPLYDPSAAYLAKKAAAGDQEAQSILSQQTKQAGAKAGAEAAAKFPYEMQLKQQELAGNPVFAVNPKTGRRELTTVDEAKSQGFTNPVKVTQGQIENETTLNAQMNDLQLNLSRYKAALNAMGPLSKSDIANMTHILAAPDVHNAILQNAGMPALMSMIEQGSTARDWNALSPDKQQAVIGALRMKNSALLFQKVSTGMGRASKEAMDIEIANMPSPIEGATVGNQKLQAFQENVDTMATRAVKLPWQETPQDVKARIEGQATDQYNQRQAAKPQGQYTAKGQVTVGQNIQIPNTSGLSRVKKVYPDGSFDADQKR
jgi:hypothetical protein